MRATTLSALVGSALMPVLAVSLSACSSSEAVPAVTVTATQTVEASPSSTPSVSPTPSATPTPTATPKPELPDALTIAEALANGIDTAYDVQKVTVKNDPNDLIGRPGGYTSAAYIYDENAESFDSGLTIDNGAKIESFKTERDARLRSNYLKGLMSVSPLLGGNYSYIEGPVLLRVAQDVPPKVARKYRDLFRSFMEPYL